MLLLGFWAMARAALLDPQMSGGPSLVMTLALVAAALLVVAAVALPVLGTAITPGMSAFARRSRTQAPRLRDPDAAGRPRPRAPATALPAA
ncbi:DUF6412 domain-containing protein [Actinoplanes sp. NPDC051851]|uniref:DUF6412 domain-containing protein n=1 Tax=Actinoplanes sp. NPDC051851 TaxID=3154753 RepID=UPI0034164BBB